jgi:hypothetical protein
MNDPNFAGEEVRDIGSKHHLGKFGDDLFHDEDNKSEPVIRVKRQNMPNKGDKWKVMQDNDLVFVIESTKISKAERGFLLTVDGFNFVLQQAKKGIKSLNAFRVELKKALPTLDKQETVAKTEKIVVEKSEKRKPGRPKKVGKKKA